MGCGIIQQQCFIQEITMSSIKPQTSVPSLEISLTDGTVWKLSERKPKNFTMIVFYRGLHCPICKVYMRELNNKMSELSARGVEVIGISSDTKERALQAREQWGLTQLAIGYGLPIAKAREWGLFISKAIKENESAEFSEPGLFLVKPDGTLYAASINTMPFARPHFDEVLGAIDFVVKNNYPARGEA